VATKYAVAALAGELATGMGITGWDEFDAYNAVGVVFKKWLDNRGTIGQQEPERAVEQVRNFLLRHGMTTRFMLVKRLPNGHFEMELPERQHNNLAGYRYANAEGNHEFIVLPEAFRDEMCTGLTAKNVTQTLKDRGYLQVEGNDNIPQVRRLLPGMDRYMRVYHFYPSILGDGDVLQAEVENENQQ
jgi:putative DNA primase/helicase